MDWDNLRVFLAVARCGSMLEASRLLKLSQSTVSRRIQRLERDIGRKLFERAVDGLALTTNGQKLLAKSSEMEGLLNAVDITRPSASPQLSGEIRLGTTEAFGSYYLAPHLGHFCAANPAVTIDLLPMPRFLNLSKREADTAIAIERPLAEGYVASKLTDYRLLPYATQQYLGTSAPITCMDDLRKHRWVDYVDDLVFSPQQFSLRTWIPSVQASLRSTSVLAQAQAVRAGLGIGVLPCFLAQQFPDLVPIMPAHIDITRTFWLVAPPERREIPCVRALWTYIKQVVEADQSLLLNSRMLG